MELFFKFFYYPCRDYILKFVRSLFARKARSSFEPHEIHNVLSRYFNYFVRC